MPKFNEEYKNLKDKIHIIFYMLQNDSGRVLQDKEIQLIENFLSYNIPIYFISSRVQKNNYKSFIRNVEERMKIIKSNIKLEDLKSHIFCIDSTNKSIKNLIDAVIKDLNYSKTANLKIINELKINNIINNSINNENDKNENLISSFEIIENTDEKIEEEKYNKIMEEMKKSIFFNDISNTLKNIRITIKEIANKIKKESNTHLVPLLTAKNDLIKLVSKLKKEFSKFLTEEKMKENFPELCELSDISMDENSIGLIFDALVCFIGFLIFGSIGSIGLIFGIPIYYYTGNHKKKNIEEELDENAKKMLKKFKEAFIDEDSIKKLAEEYNNVIDKFIEFSYYFNEEHENDIDLLKIKNKY